AGRDDFKNCETCFGNPAEDHTDGACTLIGEAKISGAKGSIGGRSPKFPACRGSGTATAPATEGADMMAGSPGVDVIFALAGPDTARGGVGDDCIYGGKGPDWIHAGDGNDLIQGG